MIARFLLPSVAAAALGVGVWGYWQDQRADRAERDAAALLSELTALKAANEFNRILADQANANRIEAEKREAQTARAMEQLLTGDFLNADTPIDPRITDLLECLRTDPTGDCVRRPGDPG